MVDRPEAKVEWPSVLHGGVTHLNEFGALVVFPAFGGDQGQGEFGGNDRQVGPEFQQPGDGTNMVFMPVSNDEGVNIADFVFDGAKVGQDKVDPGFAGGGYYIRKRSCCGRFRIYHRGRRCAARFWVGFSEGAAARSGRRLAWI